MNNFGEKVSFIWSIADLIRDTFKRGKYHAKERIRELNPNATVFLFGQEVNSETFAVCKSDLYMKSLDGRDAESIKFS